MSLKSKNVRKNVYISLLNSNFLEEEGGSKELDLLLKYLRENDISFQSACVRLQSIQFMQQVGLKIGVLNNDD